MGCWFVGSRPYGKPHVIPASETVVSGARTSNRAETAPIILAPVNGIAKCGRLPGPSFLEFMEKENIHFGFGIMGGYNQARAHAQFISNLVDHNMNIQGVSKRRVSPS